MAGERTVFEHMQRHLKLHAESEICAHAVAFLSLSRLLIPHIEMQRDSRLHPAGESDAHVARGIRKLLADGSVADDRRCRAPEIPLRTETQVRRGVIQT